MRYIAWDTETYLIETWQQAPKLVCLSWYDGKSTGLLDRAAAVRWFAETLAQDDVTLVAHNAAFDLTVMAAARRDLLPLILKALAEGRLLCTMLEAALYDLAKHGTCSRVKYEDGLAVTGNYALDKLIALHFDIHVAKEDTWRLRYAELDGIPIDQWPEDAVSYAKDDARYALLLHHKLTTTGVPVNGAGHQACAQLALRLITCTGLFTDPVYIGNLRNDMQAMLSAHEDVLLESGLIEPNQGPTVWAKRFKLKVSRKNYKAYAARKGLPNARKATLSEHPRWSTRRICEAILAGPEAQQGKAITKAMRKLGIWVSHATRVNLGKGQGEGYKSKQAEAKKLAEQLCAKVGPCGAPRTDKGEISITPELITYLSGKGEDHKDLPLLKAYIEYKRGGGILTAIDRVAAGVNAPLHPGYRTLVDTGRTSSGGGHAGINMQNLRREYGFREAFIPPKDMVLVSIDYSQLELCTLAQVQLEWFGMSALANAINDGKDCHVYAAATFLGIPYEEAITRHKAKDKVIKSFRQMSKAFNFGAPGGLGERTFLVFAKGTYGVDIPPTLVSCEPASGYATIPDEHTPKTLFVDSLPAEVFELAEVSTLVFNRTERPVIQSYPDDSLRVPTWWVREKFGQVYVKEGTYAHLRHLWLKAYPEMLMYFERVKQLRKDNDNTMVQLYSGRHRADTGFTDACNTMFQGLAADGAKQALFDVTRACYTTWGPEELNSCRPVGFIHDEILLAVPKDNLHAAAYAASGLMVDAMRKWTPDVDIKAEPAAMRRWTKSADDARISPVTGQLIPEEDYQIQYGDGWNDDYRAFFERHQLELMP